MISSFQFFSFPSGGVAKFFQISKKENFHFKLQKRNFFNFFILNFAWWRK
jgi:hypothetical protein